VIDELRRLEQATEMQMIEPDAMEKIGTWLPLHEQAAKCCKALAGHPALFCQDRRLVHVGNTGKVVGVKADALRLRLSERVQFKRTNNDGEEVDTHPRKDLAMALCSAGDWPGMRTLDGVTRSPLLRPDGSICARNGYDTDTRMLVLLDGEFPAVELGADPRLAASAACSRLLEHVGQFPFRAEADRAAHLASLLTVVGRSAFQGPSPGFVWTANQKDSGKTLLARSAGLIAVGEEIGTSAFPKDSAEQRKRITGYVAQSKPIVLFDNVVDVIKGVPLDIALTTTRWEDRLLGASQIYVWPMRAVFFITANNATYGADTARRVLPIRLERPAWRPAKYDIADVMMHVGRHRPGLVADALTILSAYICAGKPLSDTLPPFPSYEAWNLIREVVVWCGLPDPLDTREDIDRFDTEQDAHMRLLRLLRELFGDGSPFHARRIVDALSSLSDFGAGWDPRDATDVFEELGCWDRDTVNTRSLGRQLIGFLDRRDADGWYITAMGKTRNGARRYRLKHDGGRDA